MIGPNSFPQNVFIIPNDINSITKTLDILNNKL